MAKAASATDIFPHGDADQPLVHGGDLSIARRLFPDAPEPFVDLSTGINPYPYKVPHLAPGVFARLPEAAAFTSLAEVAAKAYGAPSAACVVPAPGTQILLPLVAGLLRPGRAAVIAPTYAEHARAAALAGHSVADIGDIGAAGDAGLVIVTHPNNPDGRLFHKVALIDLAKRLRPRGGLLIVDEAFMDVGPSGASLAGEVLRGNIVVLRSFGKFFGLAGLRLGFAIAAPAITARLAAMLGPWAVSGPALAVGTKALADRVWIDKTRGRLTRAAAKLDTILTDAGLKIVGGTTLFRLVQTPAADKLFHHLGRAGILVRPFPNSVTWLRFGLPAKAQEWRRLQAALAAFRKSG
jgi:cobalamin biosynthetic protein CobC